MLKLEALRAELDQTRLRGAPLHHGYEAPQVTAVFNTHCMCMGACHWPWGQHTWTELTVSPHGPVA